MEHRVERLAARADGHHLDVCVAEQLEDGLALDVVVLDDQQPLRARRGEVLDAVECGLQTLCGGRLDEVGERAVREAVLALLFQSDDLHRDVARARVELELVEHRPAEHVGKEDVERDGRGAELPGEGQALRALGGDDAFEAFVARKTQEDAGVVRVVLDDEQRRVTLLDGVAIVLDVLVARDGQHRERPGQLGRRVAAPRAVGAGVVQRQVEGERAALSVDAGELDLTAEQDGQLAADGETEAGAAVFAGRAGVGLLKRLEDEPLLLRRDADAGVLDREGEDLRRVPEHGMIEAPATRRKTDADIDVAGAGELHGVGQQVLQDLLQPLRVAAHGSRQVFGELHVERQVLGLGHVAEVAVDRVAQAGEADVLDVDGHRAGLDFREIEDVVDEVEEVGAGGVDVA